MSTHLKPNNCYIEISGVCNARCPYCVKGSGAQKQGHFMSVSTFERILNQLQYNNMFPLSGTILPFNWGEPLLHPKINEILAVIGDYGLKAFISTNLIYLPKLNQKSLDVIIGMEVSLSGFSQKAYGKMHGHKLSKVLKNIDELLSVLADAECHWKPAIRWHRYRFNENELNSAKSYFQSKGISLTPVVAFLNDGEKTKIFISNNTLSIEENEKIKADLFTDFVEDSLKKCRDTAYICPAWSDIAIDENANLLICCGFSNEVNGAVLGSLFDLSKEEIILKKQTSPLCKPCLKYGMAKFTYNTKDFSLDKYLEGKNHQKTEEIKKRSEEVSNPLVSIGMPVYNGKQHIEETIQSILRQDYKNIELIISDNASDDGTSEICEKYAKTDNRIKYSRNISNQSREENFLKVFHISLGKYYMWATCDNRWEPSYVSSLVEQLEKNPSAVLAVSKIGLIDINGNKKEEFPHPFLSSTSGMSKAERIFYMLEHVYRHLIYGIFRRSAVGQNIPYLNKGNLTGLLMDQDVLFVLRCLNYGDLATINMRLFYYRSDGESMREGYSTTSDIMRCYGEFTSKLFKCFDISDLSESDIIELQKAILNRLKKRIENPHGKKLEDIIIKAMDLTIRGEKFLADGEVEKALSTFSEAIKVEPSCAKAHYNLGILYSQTNLDKARYHLEKAIAYVPDNAQAEEAIKNLPDHPRNEQETREEMYQEIRHLVAKGENIGAINALTKLLELYPEWALAHNDLGELYKKAGNNEKALGHYKIAIELQPENITFLKNLADFYAVGLGNIEAAIKVYVLVLSHNSRDIETLIALGNICLNQHKINDAKNFFIKVLELQPENVDARSALEDMSPKLSTNLANNFPKFSFITIVLNGMPFLEYAIKAIYEFAHEIVIVEGAVQACMFAANPDGSSKDGTVEFIKNFQDPQKKIKFIQGQWTEKVDMQNRALEHITGDYIWLVDSDEIYKHEDFLKVRELIQQNCSITQINFIPDNFWKGFDHIFVSPIFFQKDAHYRRVFKFVKGATFSSHRPPTLFLPGSEVSTEEMNLVDGNQTRKMGIIPFHYSYIYKEQVVQKIELYNRYGWGKGWGIDLKEWYNECFLKWTPSNRQDLESKYPVWTGDKHSHTKCFEGTHPVIMMDFVRGSLSHAAEPGDSLFVMGHVIRSIGQLKQHFSENHLLALETGTIRSYDERHNSTYHISRALGNSGTLISVDTSELSIRRSKNICHDAGNIEFVQSDSVSYLTEYRDHKFHFVLLDSINDKDVIFEEFSLVLPLMTEGGIIIVDDSGISRDGKSIDRAVAAEKGHRIWEYTRARGVEPLVMETPAGHGTQLKIVMTGEVISRLQKGICDFLNRIKLSHQEVPKIKIAEDHIKSGMKVEGESSFATSIQKLFQEIRPQKIIETGTYIGTGTTAAIASAIKNLARNDSIFYSIEVNPTHYQQAQINLSNNKLIDFVKLLNGLSVPRTLLPTIEEIKQKCVKDIEFDGIFVDHQEYDRALLYWRETNFENLPDNLLLKCLEEFDYAPDFILLDSGGHMGNIEFNYLISRLKGECYIALDDINHIKHHKSFLQVQVDPRFELITSSEEKFGFCIAKFTPSRKLSVKEVKKILWIRTDSIGDNILASSMVPHIHKQYKGATITVVCQERVAPLYEACNLVDNVITFDRDLAIGNDKYIADIIKKLRALHADIAFNSVYSREPLTDRLTLESGAREKIAFKGDLCNISPKLLNRNNLYYNRLIENDETRKQELERHKDYLEELGIKVKILQPEMWLSADDEKYADKIFLQYKLDKEKTIALFAGAQYDIRVYDHYGNALTKLCRDKGYTVIALGSSGEHAINQKNIDEAGVSGINLCGETTLGQTAAIIKRCKVALGSESGLSHMACAVGTPNIVLMGGGHFGRFMPYSPLTSIVCLPIECYGCNWQCKFKRIHCIKDIATEVIEEAIRQTVELPSTVPRLFIQGSSLWHTDSSQPKWKFFDEFINIDNVEIIPVGKLRIEIKQIRKSLKLIEKGEDYFNNEQIEKAEIAFNDALSIDDQNARIYNNLGVLYYHKGDKEKALEHYEEASKIEPLNITFQKNRADFYAIELGDIEEAMKIYVKVLSLASDDIDSIINSGQICAALQRNDDANDFYRRALEIEPWNALARQSIEKLPNTKQMPQTTNTADNSYEKIQSMLNNGQEKEAFEALKLFTESNLDFALAHNDLGVLYFRKGEKDKALLHYVMAAELQPENITFQKNLADFYYIILGRIEDALRIYTKVLADHPDDIETLLAIGHISRESNQYEDAKDFYRMVLDYEPGNPHAIDAINEIQNFHQNNACETLNENPTVSIVMFTYNRIEYSKEALHRLMHSTSYPFDLYIIDNNSTDGTQEWLEEVRLLYPNRIKNIQYNETNEGLPGPTNAFWKSVTTDLVGKVDNDTLVPKGWLERLVDAHKKAPNLAVVGGYHFRPEDFDKTSAMGNLIEENGIKILPDTHIGGCCYLMKKSIQEKFGLMEYDPSLKTHGWTQYQNKLAKAGYIVGYLYPLIQLDYMDDPRSEKCLINEKYQDYTRKIWRERGIEFKSTDQLVTWLHNDAQRVTGNKPSHAPAPVKKGKSTAKPSNDKPAGYYGYARPEIQELVPKSAKRILDIGCGAGRLGKELKNKLGAEVWGIEIIKEAADIAKDSLDKVIVNDIEHALAELPDKFFNTIIFADVLEHMINPQKVLRDIKSKLSDNGELIASIPNVRHWSVLKNLIEGSWDYQDAGILDRTHLRFFTRKNIIEMFNNAGYSINAMKATSIQDEKIPDDLIEALSASTINAVSLKEESNHYQYLIRANARQQVDSLVSIVILTYNQLDYTRKCIESIFRHTEEPFELIVVDNGSTDRTVEYLESEVRRQKSEVKIIKNNKNLGFAAGNNQGMAVAEGNYVLLMNNDIVVTPGWLGKLISCAERHPKAGIAGPMTNYVNGPQLVKKVGYDTDNLKGLNEFSKEFVDKHAGQATRFPRVIGFCMLIKRAVIDKIGGLDESYGLGNLEDDDYCLRTAFAGFETWIAKDCFIHHFGSKTFTGANIDYQQNMIKNWEIFKEKWGIPQDLPCGLYDMNKIGVKKFNPHKHYCPLPKEGAASLNKKGEDLFADGRLEEARDLFIKALEITPAFALAHNNLGVAYTSLGNKEKALKHYEKAVQLSSFDITFKKNLADFYFMALGRIEDALKHYISILSSNPEEVETLLALGKIAESQQKPDDATTFYKNVLDIEPENIYANQALDALTNLDQTGLPQVLMDAPAMDSKEPENKNLSYQESSDNETRLDHTTCHSIKWPRIIIVTPSFNQGRFLEECIDSILGQNYPNLEYIIMDGGSTDNSVEIIKKYEKHLTYWQSEPDKGQYDAINEGFKKSNGEIMTWLNSDDKLCPHTLATVAKIFIIKEKIDWITGRPNILNEKGEQEWIFDQLPLWSREKYLNKDYKYIQQEGTFWRSALWEKAGSTLQTDLDLAGDLELWARFFRHSQLHSIDTLLAGYRTHPNQKAQLQRDQYEAEADKVLDNEIALFEREERKSILPAPEPISTKELNKILAMSFESENKEATSWNRKGETLFAQGNVEGAKQAFLKAIEIDPGFALPHNNLGVLHGALGNREKAVKHYEKAIELNPMDLNFMKNMANFYYAIEEDINKAIKIYTNIIAANPKDVETLFALGQISIDTKRLDEAKIFFKKVLEEEPGHVDAREKILQLEREEISDIIKTDLPSHAIESANNKASDQYLISAIVSTYNSEKFIKGCLESLENQTIAEKIEIIVINSGSQQNEEEIVLDFQKRYPNIKYIKTEQRESVYAAWNRGIKAATGKYITNSNTDDRHNRAAFEIMAKTLEANPDKALAYADMIITETENETFDSCTPIDYFRFLDWDRKSLLDGTCFMGSQPMWRKSVHDEYGYFDDSFITSGDYEFWLRISQTDNFIHILALLGLYLKSPGSLEHSNREKQREENSFILQMYRNAHESGEIVRRNYQDSQEPEPVSEAQENNAKKSEAYPYDVTIIVVASSKQKQIDRCLKSIKKYSKEPYEVIFVNDNLDAGTFKWLKSLIKKEKNYHLTDNGKLDNRAAAINEAVKKSTGEYVAIIRDDLILTERWLSGMAECFKASKDVGLVGPMTNSTKDRQLAIDSDFKSLKEINKYASSFREMNRNRRIETGKLDSFCITFERRLVDRIGFFDDKLVSYEIIVEDFCLRARLAGLKIMIAGDIFIYKSKGDTFAENRKAFNLKWRNPDLDKEIAKKLFVLKTVDEANRLNHMGELDKAVDKYLSAIGNAPDDESLYFGLSEMLLDASQYQGALDAINKLPSGKHKESSLLLTGYCKEGLEQHDEAKECASLILAKEPESARAINLQGIISYNSKDNEKAEGFFRKAIESDPSYGEPHSNLGVIKWINGHKDKALELMNKAFILSPTSSDIITSYHTALSEVGDFKKMAHEFGQAKTLFPWNKKITFLLIDSLIQQEKFESALELIQDAVINFGAEDDMLSAAIAVRNKIKTKNNSFKKKGALSVCMIVKNEEQFLAKCLNSLKPVADELIVVDTGSKDNTKAIASLFGANIYDYKWNDDFSDARNYSLSKANGEWILVMDADEVISPRDYEQLTKITKKHSSKPVAYSFVSRNYTTLANPVGWTGNDGKYQDEEVSMGWVPSVKVRLFKNNPKIRFEYPVHEVVEPSIKKIGIPIKSCSIPIHHYGKLNEETDDKKGEIYYEIGKQKLAEMGDDPAAVRELAIQAGKLEKQEESIELWERYLKLAPDMAEAYVNISHAYMQLGKYSEALSNAKRAVEIAPKMKEAKLNYSTCKLYLGEVEESISVLEELIKINPDYLSGQFKLATAYCSGGRKQEGINLFNKLKSQENIQSAGLAIACHSTAKKLLSANREDYAALLLESAIEAEIANKDVLDLLSECNKTGNAN